MSQAAKFGDPVVGVDVHLVLVPTPAGLVPTPLPHPFVGVVFDPLGAAVGSAMAGGLTFVNGMPVANTGMNVRGIPHIPTPPGVSFAPNDIPGNHGTIVTGSKTVHMAGGSAARRMSMVSSCGFPLNLPTSVCMAIPLGAPVNIGGPTAMDWMAAITTGIRTKWFSDALHKLLKPGKWLSKAICFLTGHPVDVMTGRVLTDRIDFELPGPIPLVFECNYQSRDRGEGPLGPAWHHPLEASVQELGGKSHKRRKLVVRLPDGRESPHEGLSPGEAVWDPIDRYELLRTKHGYRLTFWDGLTYHFGPVERSPVSHPLLRITDRCDNAIELRYVAGRLAEVTDSVGRELRFTTRGGRLTSVLLLLRNGEPMELVRYTYDRSGRLASATDPKGHAMQYRYKGGVLVQETNRNGLNFYFAYDWYHPEGWCIRTWGDGGIYERRIRYDARRHFTSVDDSRGGRTMYWGNDGGLVDRETDPTGRTKSYEWHPQQYRKTAEIDGEGNRTEWVYDNRGNTVLERDALGHETRRTFNQLNVPTEIVDAAGGLWKRHYDDRGKPKSTTNPLGEVTRFKHGVRGELVLAEDPKGRRLQVSYTARGEFAAVTDWEGHTTRYELDDLGRVVQAVNPLGATTTITRDRCGLPIVIQRPDKSVVRTSFDPEGNLTRHTDALGNVTEFRYGGFNKRVERQDPLGGVVRYIYDKEGDLTGVTNEAGETYGIEVDGAGRVVKEFGFDGRKLEFWYDKAGRCDEIVNAQMKRTKLVRDPVGRVVTQVVPNKPILGDPLPKGEGYEYAYDALGGLVRAKNDAAEVTFVRDALGRVIEERVDGHVVESRYDTAGDRIGRRTGLGHETLYDFDGNGGLLGVTFNMGPIWGSFDADALANGGSVRRPWQATFTRDGLGQEVDRKLPGGVVSVWDRDEAGRPKVHRIRQESVQVSAVGYQWRSNEQLAGLIDTHRGPTWFQHDARSYLVAAQSPDGGVQYRAPTPWATSTVLGTVAIDSTPKAGASSTSTACSTFTTTMGNSSRRWRPTGSAGNTPGTSPDSLSRSSDQMG